MADSQIIAHLMRENFKLKGEIATLSSVSAIVAAAVAVVAFDWSDNDADAVAAIDRLREAVNRPAGPGQS
jgi:hypothetical protein